MSDYLKYLFVYGAVSFLFYKNPQLLWKRKTFKSPILQAALDKKCTLHISHRGGSRENLENTLESFTHAVISLLKI